MNSRPQIIVVSFYDSNLGDEALRRKLSPIDEMPSVAFYPYAELTVPGANTQVFLCAKNVDEITPEVREELVRRCSDYGPEHAENGVPSLDALRSAWQADAANRA